MTDDVKIINEIEAAATELLSHCVDDYAMRIWAEIRDDVILDVFECSGINNGDGFAVGDIALAIGRVCLVEWEIKSGAFMQKIKRGKPRLIFYG